MMKLNIYLKTQNYSDYEIKDFLLNCNQIELIDKCKNGEYIKSKYICKMNIHKKICKLLNKVLHKLPDLGLDEDKINGIISSTKRNTNFEILKEKLTNFFENNNLDTTEIDELFSEYNEKYSNGEISKQK